MRIEKLKLKDVGPFKDLDLDLGPAPRGAEVVILTGPNGCGKSTILYALADLLAPPNHGQDLVARRMRSASAFTAIDQGARVVRRNHPSLGQDAAFDPWSGIPLGGAGFRDGERLILHGYTTTPVEVEAFAYAGGRSIEPYQVDTIREPEGPMVGALSFEPAMGQRLADWVASTRAKEALASTSGDQAAADRYRVALRAIEDVLSEVTSRPTKLEVSHQPLDVRLKWGGQSIPLDLLPEGLKSILCWVADLLLRLGRLRPESSAPLLTRRFVLLLDEVEVHLHPAWQRQILPLVQRLFTNAQVIVSTHSPFVVSSCPGAKVVCLQVDEQDGTASLRQIHTVGQGESYAAVLESVFGFDKPFDPETQRQLESFYALRDKVLRGQRPLAELKALAQPLLGLGVEVRDIVALELRQAERRAAASSAP